MIPTNPSISIAPYPIIRASVSLSSIFGVVPDETSAWKPEIAPHAIVTKTNGKIFPGMIGPPPWINSVTIGIFNSGMTTKTPITRAAIVPIFMYELK